MNTTELQDLIAQAPYTRATIQTLAERLPEEDAALDALIGEAVQRSDDVLFIELVMAALSRGRPVAARHLARGAMLLKDKWQLGAFACQMQGEVSGPLLKAITETPLAVVLVAGGRPRRRETNARAAADGNTKLC